ncbi:SCO2322 family protein [Streptomyces winkii]|uniref:SCO2322 family protein n=1 Tax=Streptomyces winkii TaxID=3051178 RepID=UPI0028D7495A|nr:SCO2322 family protein [Streptomyces sp. DSM 40971]
MRARRAAAAIGPVLLAVAAVQTPAGAAGASEAGSASARLSDSGSYRYWSFWEQNGKDGGWKYATQGPSVLRPGDGDVLGFRFALSEDSKDAAQPRGRAEFADICGDTDPKPGRQRIALSIDFGTPADAPRGEKPPGRRTACAQVDADATAADALAGVAEPLRYNSAALLCAVDGYPRRGCGERVPGSGSGGDSGNGADKGEGSGGGSGTALGPATGVAAGLAAVATLALAAARRSRRRRDS